MFRLQKFFPLVLFPCLLLSACAVKNTEEAVLSRDAESSLQRALERNEAFQKMDRAVLNTSQEIRTYTKEHGQKPYIIVLTCSDSRVIPEATFLAGIGEIFTIRNAGNVVDETVLGSIEYAAEHLGTKLVLVLGHTSCGAVAATIEGGGHGNIQSITDKIEHAIGDEHDATKAEQLNVRNSMNEIQKSEILQELIHAQELSIVGAIYDIETGKVQVMQ